jgi:hypothetical protein
MASNDQPPPGQTLSHDTGFGRIPTPRRPPPTDKGHGAAELLKNGSSPIVQPQPTPNGSGDVSAGFAQAGATSNLREAGVSVVGFSRGKPGGPGNVLSDGELAKTGGFPANGQGPRTSGAKGTVKGSNKAAPRTGGAPSGFRGPR